MQNYLTNKFDSNSDTYVSVTDELPLWSAPFGQTLLDTIIMKQNINCLDIGSGTGFPLIEIAQRLGESCMVYGIEPWIKAVDRIKEKLDVYDINNVKILNIYAEDLPFDDDSFELIVSNNGINNVQDDKKVLSECFRVMKKGGQFVFTVNLPGTMSDFYMIFKSVLEEYKLMNEIQKMNEHIYEKRKPIDVLEKMVNDAGFTITNKIEKSFDMRYIDGTTFFNHFVIRSHFLPLWKEILPRDKVEMIFEQLELKLNEFASEKGELKMNVPYVCFDCRKG